MYWFAFSGNNILLRHTADGYRIPQGDEPPTAVKEWTVMQPLPDMMGEKAVAYNAPAAALGDEGLTYMGLRESWNYLSQAEYLMAGKAAELLYWDSNTRYCGVCGAPMKRHTDISKRCTNCGKEVWPHVAPAIIVRICRQDTDEILMVHARNFRRQEMYGLVAGFVETGETLEECVMREVEEEVGLTITNLRYFGSQPWPYPCGMMLGFTADYAGGEIKIQEEELSRAAWFSRNNMPPIPDGASMARMLIDDWLGAGKQ